MLVSHDQGGGVARRVAERCAAIRDAGLRPIVLRPAVDAAGARIAGGVAVSDGAAPDDHSLVYRLPDEVEDLAALLGPDRPQAVELHHLLGHHPSVTGLAARLGVPLDVHVHDYHWFCPRIALVGRERRYCGEPELAACAECIADAGSHLEEEIAVSDLVARSAALLGGARRVVAPSADCAGRLRRHFPGLRPTVEPWEDDATLPEPATVARPISGRGLRVLVAGGIGIEKGYEMLLACARDAARRRLVLSFVVVGHTIDDARLWDTGVVAITGPYADAEAEALILAQQADLGFLPSLWPETWSYALLRDVARRARCRGVRPRHPGRAGARDRPRLGAAARACRRCREQRAARCRRQPRRVAPRRRAVVGRARGPAQRHGSVQSARRDLIRYTTAVLSDDHLWWEPDVEDSRRRRLICSFRNGRPGVGDRCARSSRLTYA